MHAVMRVLSLASRLDRSGNSIVLATQQDYENCTRVIVRMIKTGFMVTNKAMEPKKTRKWVRCFVEERRPDVVIIDDPDVEALSYPQYTPETSRWRSRMEFREAVRGLDVGYVNGLVVLRKPVPLTVARVRSLLASGADHAELTTANEAEVADAIQTVRTDA